MSIFTKDCPVCAAIHPIHMVRCGCGYCFDPNKLDGVTQELEVIAQEERLYRDYFAARADQADRAMRFAKTAAAMEPTNNVKGAEALLAEQTAMTARAELDAQDARAHAVKERIKVVRSNRRSRRQAKASASPARSLPSVRAAFAPIPAPRPAAPTLAPVKAMQQIQPAPIPTPIPVKVPVPEPKVVAPAPKPAAAIIVTPAIAPRAAPSRNNSANRGNAVAKTPTAMPVPAPIPTLTAKKKLAVATAAVVIAQPKPTRPVTPAALAKPQTPAQPARASAVNTAAPAAPTIAHKPTTAFRAAQANKAAQVETTVSGPAKQECPNCYAKVPTTAKRCRCGFEMPLFSSQIPSLTMSPEDRAAFMAALAPIGNDKDR